MSRPRKNKIAPSDSRAAAGGPELTPDEWAEIQQQFGLTEKPMPTPLSPEEDSALASIARQHQLDRLRVDPLGNEPLASVFGPIILGTSTDSNKELAGDLFCKLLENGTSEMVEGFLKRVSTLKRNHEALPHRNGFAYFAYCRFVEAAGKEPTKSQLKKFIIARPEEYRDQPSPDGKKEWTELWKRSGLFTLQDR